MTYFKISSPKALSTPKLHQILLINSRHREKRKTQNLLMYLLSTFILLAKKSLMSHFSLSEVCYKESKSVFWEKHDENMVGFLKRDYESMVNAKIQNNGKYYQLSPIKITTI